MPSSVFTRPRARPPLAAVSSQQNRIDVSTEDELLAALTVLPRSDGACYGRAINIISDISVKQPIYLTEKHSGLTITSSSKSKIFSTKNIECVFNVGANTTTFGLRVSDIGIENLFLSSTLNANYFIVSSSSLSTLSVKNITVDSATTILLALIRVSQNNNSIIVSGCRANLNIPLLIGQFTTARASNATIVNNVGFYGGISACSMSNSVISSNSNFGGWSTASDITAVSSNNVFSMNTIITGRNIVIGNPLSQGNSIIGNCFLGSGGNINTSATAGSNSIVGNTNVGTITNAATDAVTSNT